MAPRPTHHPPRDPFVLAKLGSLRLASTLSSGAPATSTASSPQWPSDQVGVAGAGRARSLPGPCSPPPPLLPPAAGSRTKGLRLQAPTELRAGTVMLSGHRPSSALSGTQGPGLTGLLAKGRRRLLSSRGPLLPAPPEVHRWGRLEGIGVGEASPIRVTALRDYSHPQRSPTSLSHGGLRPAPDSSTSVISASTESARKTSPRCVAGVGWEGVGGWKGG